MHQFREHIQKHGYVATSIPKTISTTQKYLRWLQENNQAITTATYKDLLDYIGYLRDHGNKSRRINEHLRGIRLYYTFLKLPNIAYGVKVRGEVSHQLPLWSEAELTTLYHHFTPKPVGIYGHTDKLFLGMIIYQTLTCSELMLLELSHLNLNEGTLYIPGGFRNKNARRLSLQSHQILPLHQYVVRHRDKSTRKLFSYPCAKYSRLHDQLKDLAKRVKTQAEEIDLNFIRFNQLRQSRILHWIRQYGVRKAQYLAGYRWVSSVEKYKQEDTEDLQASVNQYHPLQ
jgi:site-specific recombinase XerD